MGNTEAPALRLNSSFWTFVQGDLSVSEFCRQMKGMADSLGDLGCPMEDRILVLNVLYGLSQGRSEDRVVGHARTGRSRGRGPNVG